MPRLSYKFVKEKFEERGYKMLDDFYVRNNIDINIECPNHHKTTITYGSFMSGRGCRVCANNQKNNHQTVKDYVESFGYTLISKSYKNNHEKLQMVCDCGHECTISLKRFKEWRRCQKCFKSRGEHRIAYFLKSHNIHFEVQKTFEGCLNKNDLCFDFYIPQFNLCIEFDGIQHFEPVNDYGGVEDFVRRVANDKIKNQYCQSFGLPLLRIAYTDFENIEYILTSQFENLKLQTK